MKETINIVLDKWAIIPSKAHEDDAGIDLHTPYRVVLRKHDSVVIDTGVHVEIPKGCVGMLKSKSGLNTKHDITCEGVIDCGYTGSIRAMMRNHSGKDYIFEIGDKITQLVIMPYVNCDLKIVDSLGETERGDNGFGSSGK